MYIRPCRIAAVFLQNGFERSRKLTVDNQNDQMLASQCTLIVGRFVLENADKEFFAENRLKIGLNLYVTF